MEIPSDLILQLSGFVDAENPYHRNILFDELYDRLPKDPAVRVRVYTGEVGPGVATDWHIHNGASFFLVVQGRVRLEYRDSDVEYRAGDVFTEPIGQLHRAVNPDDTVPMVAFGFQATSPDREHVVNVARPW